MTAEVFIPGFGEDFSRQGIDRLSPGALGALANRAPSGDPVLLKTCMRHWARPAARVRVEVEAAATCHSNLKGSPSKVRAGHWA